MNEYLTKKYGTEFKFVEKPYLTGNEGFGYKYQAKAIPVGKPELEFFVEQEDRANPINMFDFNVMFCTNKYRQEYIANGNSCGKKSYDTLHEERALINFLKVHKIEELHPIDINSSSDLVKWFQY